MFLIYKLDNKGNKQYLSVKDMIIISKPEFTNNIENAKLYHIDLDAECDIDNFLEDHSRINEKTFKVYKDILTITDTCEFT